MHKIVFLERDSFVADFRRPSFPHAWVEHPSTRAPEVVERLQGATIAIVNKAPLPASAIDRLPDLRMVAVAATGVDVVDLPACRARGIVVSNVRDYGSHAVAEHTFMLILAVKRKLLDLRASVESGEWARSPVFCVLSHPAEDLRSATLGLVGHGAIGRRVEAIARAFGMKVLITGATPREDRVPLETLLAESDIVSLHCPLTPATRGMIDARAIAKMKPGAILINTARGGLVDEPALAHALATQRIAGAGLDVLGTEPPKDGSPLLDLRSPRVLITPHVGWASLASMQALADQLIEVIEAWHAGRPKNVVT